MKEEVAHNTLEGQVICNQGFLSLAFPDSVPDCKEATSVFLDIGITGHSQSG
jgi:hypothetical protein